MSLQWIKEEFEAAVSGTLRGKIAVSKLSGAMTQLRLEGYRLNEVRDGLTREFVDDLTRRLWVQSARENGEDASDRNRADGPTGALSDLHLVPAYMKSGGLDPDRDEDWEAKGGMTRAGHLALQREMFAKVALRSLNYAREGRDGPQRALSALGEAEYYLREWDKAQWPRLALTLAEERAMLPTDEAYAAIGTTRAAATQLRTAADAALDDIIHFRRPAASP